MTRIVDAVTGAALAAMLVAACGDGRQGAVETIDPALRQAVDAATVAYYRCIDEAAAAQLPAAEPVATIVIKAENACRAARAQLAEAIAALSRAETPALSAAEIKQVANTSILAYAPEIRQRVAAALVVKTLPEAQVAAERGNTTTDETTGQNTDAAH